MTWWIELALHTVVCVGICRGFDIWWHRRQTRKTTWNLQKRGGYSSDGKSVLELKDVPRGPASGAKR
jgi:hypothetical protein